ncbi:2-oxoglutarate dehydrogenase, partial [Operophtera brumata]
VHGDAAFTGQGVNQETLMLSQAPHFNVGGSLHIVRGRSCRYVTDLAKTIAAPVIHVNGDHPEDVFIDYNCFRRWGHNEVDDPTFTNPLLYKVIHGRKSIPDMYADRLMSEGVITKDDIDSTTAEYTKFLQSQYESVASYKPEVTYYQEQWACMAAAPKSVETWDTGVDVGMLKTIGQASVRTPSEFNVHPHLAKTHVKNRLNKLAVEKDLDWATAEALAFGKKKKTLYSNAMAKKRM